MTPPEKNDLYWDEDSKSYYAYDAATDTYFPWNETCEEGQRQEEVKIPPSESIGNPDIEIPPKTEHKEEPLLSLQESSQQSNAAAGVKEDEAEPGETEFPNFVRRATKHLTLSKHGGLAGVLQRINAERAKQKSEDIKNAQQREKLKELLKRAGIIEGKRPEFRQAPVEAVPLDTPETSQPEDSRRQSESSMRNLFQNVSKDIQPTREPQRRSTVRFGTTAVDAELQQKIEQMLKESVKKKS